MRLMQLPTGLDVFLAFPNFQHIIIFFEGLLMRAVGSTCHDPTSAKLEDCSLFTAAEICNIPEVKQYHGIYWDTH